MRLATALVVVLPLAAACGSQPEPVASTENRLGTARFGEHVDIDAIVMGDGHMCALLKDSTVRCWGGARTESFCDEVRCQNGRGAGVWSSTERSIPSLEGVLSLAAAASHTCAVIRDGSVRCWGGDESTLSTGSNSPVKGIEGLTDIVEITTALLRTCARLGTGEVRCWGRDIAPNDATNFVPGWFGAESIASSSALVLRASAGRRNFVQNTTCVTGRDGTVACEAFSRSSIAGARRRFFTLDMLQGASQLAAESVGQDRATTECDFADIVAPTCPATASYCSIVGSTLRCAGSETTAETTDVAGLDGEPTRGRVAMHGNAACFVNAGAVSCTTRTDAGDFLPAKRVPAVNDVIAVAMGRYETADACALRRDGGIVCWKTATDGSASDVAAPFYLPPELR